MARALLLAGANVTAKDKVSEGGGGRRRAEDSREQKCRGAVTDFEGATHTCQDGTTAFCADSWMPLHTNALMLRVRFCTKCTFQAVERVSGSVWGSVDGR